MTISRRSLLWAGTGLVAGRLTSPRVVLGSALQPAKPSTEASLTAAQIVDRIKAHVGIPWRAETVDNIVGGTPGTMVKGIGTTMMATLDVLRRLPMRTRKARNHDSRERALAQAGGGLALQLCGSTSFDL